MCKLGGLCWSAPSVTGPGNFQLAHLEVKLKRLVFWGKAPPTGPQSTRGRKIQENGVERGYLQRPRKHRVFQFGSLRAEWH